MQTHHLSLLKMKESVKEKGLILQIKKKMIILNSKKKLFKNKNKLNYFRTMKITIFYKIKNSEKSSKRLLVSMMTNS
jgi:hypothetical protein